MDKINLEKDYTERRKNKGQKDTWTGHGIMITGEHVRRHAYAMRGRNKYGKKMCVV